MPDQIFTTKQAAEFLGISEVTLKRWVHGDMPIEGQKLNYNTRVFRQEELDTFKTWLASNPDARKTGRKPDPQARYHGWNDPEQRRRNRLPRQQQMADQLKVIVFGCKPSKTRKEALDAISNLETLDWNPAAFVEGLPTEWAADVENETLTYSGNDAPAAILKIIEAYRAAITAQPD